MFPYTGRGQGCCLNRTSLEDSRVSGEGARVHQNEGVPESAGSGSYFASAGAGCLLQAMGKHCNNISESTAKEGPGVHPDKLCVEFAESGLGACCGMRQQQPNPSCL